MARVLTPENMFHGFFKGEAAQPVETQVCRLEENRYQVQLDGKEQEVTIFSLQENVFFLRQEGNMIPFSYARQGNSIWVWLDGETHAFEILESLPQNKKKPEILSGILALKAPMPGKIQKIFIKPGDKVDEDQPMFLLESMKMEITVSAPAACHVKELLCQAEELVEMGKILARLEVFDEKSVS